MNFLSVENLSKTWHDKPVLRNITFGIQQGEKVALVAGNGQGKSTLLQIIIGKESADNGKAIMRKDIKVGYLPQEPELLDDISVIDNILVHDSPISLAVLDYDKAIEKQSHNPTEDDMDHLQWATEKMNQLGAWDYESRVKQVLTKLKIADHDQLASSLSGGQRKRVAMAKVLLAEPDLLIMDEPTNHLDLEMIEWLEGYLSQKDLSLLLVTHDRYFLDRVCDSIIELEHADIFHYKGNYSYFVENKAMREAMIASELEKDKNLFRRELDWVRRMPKARTTKSKSRVDAFDDLEAKVKNQRYKSELNISMRMERMGAKILELHHVSKAYGDKNILDDFSYIFKRKEKVGIVGPNGVGKSTFLNMIMELETPDAGKIVTGDTMIFGYYSQQGMKVDDSKKVIDVVRDIADWIPMANGNKLTAQQLLLQFGFSHEKQWDYALKLSGGEKRRLFLMTILMKAPNFLILDEPTNDLDIETLGVLEDFLLSYDGCAIVVSHDRYFMDKVVDHIFIFEGQGQVRDFPGNYSDYREWDDLEDARKALEAKEAKELVRNPVVVIKDVVVAKTALPKEDKRKLTFKEKFEFEQLEKDIAQLNVEKSKIEGELSGLTTEFDRIASLGISLQEIQDQIDEKELRWLELSEFN
jgi:ATP-binding cassette subfamily F protein uup